MSTIITLPTFVYVFIILLLGMVVLSITLFLHYKRKASLFPKSYKGAAVDQSKLNALAVGLVNGEEYRCYSNSLSTGISKHEVKNIVYSREWRIKDHETTIAKLDKLYNEGNRAIFDPVLLTIHDTKDHIERIHLLEKQFSGDYRLDKVFMTSFLNFDSHYDMMKRHPVFRFDRTSIERGITAWDMSEIVLMSRVSFDLGYITEEEAWCYIQKAYQLGQDKYKSWQQFATGLIMGYAMCYSNYNDFNEMVSIAEKALCNRNSPWIAKCFNTADKSLILCERIVMAFISLLVLTGCAEHKAESQKKGIITVGCTDTSEFKYPEIPTSLKTPEERGEYLVKHYWDHFNFNDTTYIHKPEITEPIFVGFIDVLHNIPLTTAKEGINLLMLRTSQNWGIHNFIIDLFEKYLYDPNSSFRNDELYIPVLEYLIESPIARSEDKITSEYRLKMALKNRVGAQASDFVFSNRDGRLRRLSDIHNNFILIYFNNPGCEACRQVIAQISGSSVLKNPRLSILAIYPDEDLAEWKKAQHEIPDDWVNGYSPRGEIMRKQIYDLKAIPTLYLLDSDKKVIFKDAPLEQIVDYLGEKMAFDMIIR